MFQQSLVFIFLIVLGILLQKKISDARELKGLKIIILSIALPATIFIALLSIQFDSRYLFLPLGALGFNILMLVLVKYFGPAFGFNPNSKEHLTVMMLIPSLAPGLSCFPFLAEFMGEDGLALGALADVGNKVFVLILLYLLAIHWYHGMSKEKSTGMGKLKSLMVAMINEPINMIIIIALVMVAFGMNMSTFPAFLRDGIGRASMIMTPLILLFIGLSVRIKWRDLKQLFFLLTWRSGVAFMASALIIGLVPALTPTLALLIVVFPQSATSFWPYAHMTAINQMGGQPVFDTKMAISVLACSLPFSTLTILGVFSFESYFVNPWYLGGIGATLFLISLLPRISQRVIAIRTNSTQVTESTNYQYAE
ncbi:AEC family transporter [Fulvivirga sedimenti]|uniref:Permease n=1 Tax=Fulvivirga sedimenti TaxID=2879465 RepID=A0A9X1KYZ2_9BACT|nr:permease [Fulvivirga sedimenti]MCA6074116.1 permease [Fulvivirga sedimenti]